MNMQKRSDARSEALHREIAKKLRSNPQLWIVPKKNIERWKKARKTPMPAIIEWESILNRRSREDILAIIEGDSEESIRLRSSSPFTGILNDLERKRIFDLYRDHRKLNSRSAAVTIDIETENTAVQR